MLSTKKSISNNHTPHKRRRYKRNYNAQFSQSLRTVIGRPVYKMIQQSVIVSATAGSSTLTISPAGGTYLNVANFVNQDDFTNMATAYQVCRIKSIRVIANRLISENQLTTIFSAGLPTIYVAYFPTVSSSTVSNAGICAMENALVIPPFNNRASVKTFVLPNIIAPSTPAFSLTQYFSVNYLTNCKGQFSIGVLNAGSATASSNVYSLVFQAEFEFAVPL